MSIANPTNIGFLFSFILCLLLLYIPFRSIPLSPSSSPHHLAPGIPLIAAVGSTPSLSYHKTRGSSTLMLVRTGAPMCICAGGESGSIDGVAFRNHCYPRPMSDMLALKNDVW